MDNTILTKIKSRGYWKVNFYPTLFLKEKITTLKQCSEIMTKSVVELRGWDYPHLPHPGRKELYNNNDCLESCFDWGCFKECWRFYQSGQFIHFFAMIEDWYEDDQFFKGRQSIKAGETFSLLHNVYKVTEIFEFLKRLADAGIYKEGVCFEVALLGLKDRRLVLDDPRRVPLFNRYESQAPQFVWSGEFVEKDLVSQPCELALKLILQILSQFNWNDPPIGTIVNDQQNLLQRKL